MTMADRIRAKLEAALAPDRIDIEDQSARHAGHAGSRPGGETHYAVHVVAGAFRGLGRVERQRLVYRALATELAEGVHAQGIHALAIRAETPEEVAAGDPPR
ncbi:MAG: BolA family protein [Alphaproteobacteria bacterium]